MYRVMIVDDEFYIRKSFCNRIDWASYHMEVVGEAANGQEAYELVPVLKPDLLFVDIRMPILDGFDLATLLMDEYPDIFIIIISAYSDFQYARKAIEKGVFDYLLKPLDEEEMDKTLRRLLARMEEKEEGKKSLNLYDFQGAELENQEFVCFSIYEKSGQENGIHNQKALQRWLAEQGTLARVLGHNMPLCQVFCIWKEKIALLELERELAALFDGPWAGYGMAAGISEIHRGTQGLEKDTFVHCIAEAVSASKEKLFDASRHIFLWSRYKDDFFDISPYNTPKLAMVRSALSKKDYRLARQGLISYLMDFEWEQFRNAVIIEMIVSTVIEILFRAGWDTGLIAEVQLYTNDFRRTNFILLFERAEDIRDRLCQLIEVLMDEMTSKDSSDLAQRIALYIQENYAGNLQMEELERQFFMSSSSLLLAFKKKKNMTITAYIEAVRMEKAKKLLKSGLCSVQDTAEAVGYLDANYFCKAFKRYTGSTPSKYRVEKPQ